MNSSKLRTLLYIYILFIAVWFFLWLTIGDGPWWLTTINRVVPYLFVPVPAFLIWLLRRRVYKFTAFLVLPISIFSFLYHPYILPKVSAPDVSRASLSVMTYNILYSNYDYDAITNVILAHQPDLVALQEVLPETMIELQARLSEQYPYSVHGNNKDYAVAAVFSRYPILETKVLVLGEDHRAVIVRTDVHGQQIAFAAVHLRAYGLEWVRPRTKIFQELVARTKVQNQQVEMVWEELRNDTGPVIIGCDCNSKETSSSYRMLDQWFDSAAYQVGWQLPGIQRAGARQDTNMQHIDFIWYRGTLEPLAAYEITDSGGSDHQPILALFEIH